MLKNRKSCKKLQNKIWTKISLHAILKFCATQEAVRSCKKKLQKLQKVALVITIFQLCLLEVNAKIG